MYLFHLFTCLIFLFQCVLLNSFDNNTDLDVDFRLIYANLAKVNQFPFIVALYFDTEDGMFTCTGTIIADDLILTAAHCIDEGKIWVVHGDPDQSALYEYYGYSFERFCSSHYKKHYCYERDWALRHPDFNDKTYEHDVGIIRLKTPMPKSDGHKVFDCNLIGAGSAENCTLIGFGRYNDKDEGDLRLRYKTGVEVIFCEPLFFRYDALCLLGIHICPGDSGGPLICNNLIYGVASLVTGPKWLKCSGKWQNIYTALTTVEDFLIEHTPCKSFEELSGAVPVTCSIFLILMSSIFCVANTNVQTNPFRFKMK